MTVRSLLPGLLLVLPLSLPAAPPGSGERQRLMRAAPPAGQTLPAGWTKALNWRCIGPASMGGRIVGLAVVESDPSSYWIATASGGLLKTTNNGTTFEHQFDREATVSLGDVAVAPSNRNLVWVGTGESNPRNSVSYGDGVYKSTDGGKTWTNMGLKKTYQIGRIVIHPTNPDIVYVGALGRLYGPGEDRGLYKTSDGGKTWKKILHVDEYTGVVDLRLQPGSPDTLLVATWERQRDGFDSHAGALAAGPAARVEPPLPEGHDAYDPVKKWGKGSALWRSTDGGASFQRVSRGLPSGRLGRIGLDFYRKDPTIVFAVIDSEKTGLGRVPGYLGVTPKDEAGVVVAAEVGKDTPAQAAGLRPGDRITALDGKPIKDGAALGRAVQLRKPDDRVTLTVVRGAQTLQLPVTLGQSPDLGPRRGPLLGIKGVAVPDGVRVEGLMPGGVAAAAGMQAKDVILRLGGQPTTSLEQLTNAFRAAEPDSKVTVQVQRGNTTKELVLTAPPRRRPGRPYATFLGGQRENVQEFQGPDGHEYGGVYRSADGGATWARVNSVNSRPMYFSKVRVDPSDERLIYLLGVRLYRSEDGGKTFKVGGDSGVHADLHALWINPRDGRHLLLGTDGGTYVSYDRGGKWDYLNNTAIGQFYHVTVDSRQPYRVYGGLQDNGSWGGPSRSLDGRGPINADWVMVQGGDGFVCRVDPGDPDVVYTESQEGGLSRTNLRSGERVGIKPRAPQGQPPYRFNWNTPFLVSSHNPRIVYIGGNRVFRSLKRGDDARPISPELTTSGKASASALAESPRTSDVLWVGTDDGQLWVTRDGGVVWSNVTARVGLSRPLWVASLEPSRFAEGTCYVCFDGHRSDNDEPHLYATDDFGQTWRPIRGNLPGGSSRVLREDLYNKDLLYLGTEFSVFASLDRGGSWVRINNNLPTVAVHELVQHPTAGEMVAATHGRSLWVLDVTALRQLRPALAQGPVALLAPAPVVRWRRELQRGTIYGAGSRDYFGENPPAGAAIHVVLPAKGQSVKLTVQDYAGKTVATLPVKNESGLQRVAWDLRGTPTPLPGLAGLLPGRVLGAAGRGPQPVAAGTYRVVLTVDGAEQVQGLRIENDPTLPPGTSVAEPEPERGKREPRRDF